jgi:hypothetical protein
VFLIKIGVHYNHGVSGAEWGGERHFFQGNSCADEQMLLISCVVLLIL